ncbi:hypothetical protein OAL09_00030 [Verrucomicrobia bacterium]|nr:hypothetical protein [Verrucomicrobiota bacterium]|tara:strand:- start:2309 stop:2578 length:270 start_codon:yes stop_codon:yes gene_type:complete
MRLNIFFISLLPFLLFGCSRNNYATKIGELEKRIERLENLQNSIEKFEIIQQTIPILEALPITIQNVERIDRKIIELTDDLNNHNHKSS